MHKAFARLRRRHYGLRRLDHGPYLGCPLHRDPAVVLRCRPFEQRSLVVKIAFVIEVIQLLVFVHEMETLAQTVDDSINLITAMEFLQQCRLPGHHGIQQLNVLALVHLELLVNLAQHILGVDLRVKHAALKMLFGTAHGDTHLYNSCRFLNR